MDEQNSHTPMQEFGIGGLWVVLVGLLVGIVWVPLGLLFLFIGLTVFCFGNYASSRLGFDDAWMSPYIAMLTTFWACSLVIVTVVAIISNILS